MHAGLELRAWRSNANPRTLSFREGWHTNSSSLIGLCAQLQLLCQLASTCSSRAAHRCPPCLASSWQGHQCPRLLLCLVVNIESLGSHGVPRQIPCSGKCSRNCGDLPCLCHAPAVSYKTNLCSRRLQSSCMQAVYVRDGSTLSHVARSFYPATLYLSTSKVAVAAMGNLAFALALCTHKLVMKVSARTKPRTLGTRNMLCYQRGVGICASVQYGPLQGLLSGCLAKALPKRVVVFVPHQPGASRNAEHVGASYMRVPALRAAGFPGQPA